LRQSAPPGFFRDGGKPGEIKTNTDENAHRN
jgi:hypothetical protein